MADPDGMQRDALPLGAILAKAGAKAKEEMRASLARTGLPAYLCLPFLRELLLELQTEAEEELLRSLFPSEEPNSPRKTREGSMKDQKNKEETANG